MQENILTFRRYMQCCNGKCLTTGSGEGKNLVYSIANSHVVNGHYWGLQATNLIQKWEEMYTVSFHILIPVGSMLKYSEWSVMSTTYCQIMKTKNKNENPPVATYLIYPPTYWERENKSGKMFTINLWKGMTQLFCGFKFFLIRYK